MRGRWECPAGPEYGGYVLYEPEVCGICGSEVGDKAHCSPECESQWALMLEKAKAGTLEPMGGW